MASWSAATSRPARLRASRWTAGPPASSPEHLRLRGGRGARRRATPAADRAAHVPRRTPSTRRPTASPPCSTRTCPPAATAAVDVRGRRSTGGWTEWVPADGDASGLTVPLPEPSSEVQARLVLTGDRRLPVRSCAASRLTAHPATAPLQADGGEQGAAQLRGVRHPRRAGRRHDGQRARDQRARPLRRAAVAPRARRRATRATTRSRSAPRTAAARSPRCGTSARGTPGTTTGTRRRSARSGATSRRACRRRRPPLQRAQRRQGPVRPEGRQPRGHRPRRRAVLGRARPRPTTPG